MVSAKKIRKIMPNFTHDSVKSTVKQALSSDPEGKEKLMSDLKSKGIEKELVSCYFEVIKEEPTLLLDLSDFVYIREYISLLGAETSVQFFNDIIPFFDESDEGVHRNSCLLFEYFITTVNLLGHSKLREVVKSQLPKVIEKLWKIRSFGLAVSLAQQLLNIYMIEQSYLNEETNVLEEWENLLNKSMKKDPGMALLTCLIRTPTTDDDWTSDILSTYVFSEKDQEEDPVTSLFARFYHLVRLHNYSFFYRLNFTAATHVLAQVFKYALCRSTKENNEVEEVINELVKHMRIKGDFSTRLILTASLTLIEQTYHNAKSWSKISPWITGNLLVLADISDIDTESRLHGNMKILFDKFLKSGTTSFKMEDDKIDIIFSALKALPCDNVTPFVSTYTQAILIILASLFNHPNVTSACIHLRWKLLRNSAKTESGLIVDDPGLYTQWYEHIVEIRENREYLNEFVNLMTYQLSFACKSVGDMLTHFSLSFLQRPWAYLVTLAAIFRSNAWEKMMQLDKTTLVLTIEEVRTSIFNRGFAQVDFSNPDDFDVTGLIFDAFSYMNGEERQAILPQLFKEDKKNYLLGIANEFLNGTRKSNAELLWKIVDFRILFSYGVSPDHSAHISSALKWPILSYVQGISPKSVDRLLGKMSVDICRDLLKSLKKELLKTENIENYISVTLKIVSRMSPQHLKKIPKILSAFANIEPLPPLILALCAQCIKVVSAKKNERIVVTISLAFATTFNETTFDASALFAMAYLLYNCLRFAHGTICNDQVAVYSELVKKHFRNVQFFSQFKKTGIEEIEAMQYGCARIALQIIHYEKYFSRVVFSLISETIIGSQHLEHALTILHKINDKNSTALLTVAMPAAEKRQYSRVFPVVRRALRPVV